MPPARQPHPLRSAVSTYLELAVVFAVIMAAVVGLEFAFYKPGSAAPALRPPSAGGGAVPPQFAAPLDPASAAVAAYASWRVLLTVNDGHFDFFLNWWAHYLRTGARMGVVVVAESDRVFDDLKALGLPRLTVERSGLSSPANLAYNTSEYRAMVSTRPTHILRHLRQGTNLFYTDIDTVWRGDPTEFIDPSKDLTAATDVLALDAWSPYYCTGFMAVSANARTVALMETWEREMAKEPQLNQPIFNKVLYESDATHATFPVALFPNGGVYFDEYGPEARRPVVVVHNNFIVGTDRKRQRFKDCGLWYEAGAQRPREARQYCTQKRG
jgi:hypothetical protein